MAGDSGHFMPRMKITEKQLRYGNGYYGKPNGFYVALHYHILRGVENARDTWFDMGNGHLKSCKTSSESDKLNPELY
jgi:hypothetical protein